MPKRKTDPKPRTVKAVYQGGTTRHFPGIGLVHHGDTVTVYDFQVDGVTFAKPPSAKTSDESDDDE